MTLREMGHLRDMGPIRVTVEAVATYMRFRGAGWNMERARDELERILPDAHHTQQLNRSGTERWRYRSRPLGVDLTIHVVEDDDGTNNVVHLHCRYA